MVQAKQVMSRVFLFIVIAQGAQMETIAQTQPSLVLGDWK